MKQGDLKPCPCGGKITCMRTDHKDLYHRTHFYSCDKCDAHIFLHTDGPYLSMEQVEQEMINTWNNWIGGINNDKPKKDTDDE